MIIEPLAQDYPAWLPMIALVSLALCWRPMVMKVGSLLVTALQTTIFATPAWNDAYAQQNAQPSPPWIISRSGPLAACMRLSATKPADPNDLKYQPATLPPASHWPITPDPATGPIVDGNTLASLLGGSTIAYPQVPLRVLSAGDLEGEWIGTQGQTKILVQLGPTGKFTLYNGPINLPTPQYTTSTARGPRNVVFSWNVYTDGGGTNFKVDANIIGGNGMKFVPQIAQIVRYNGFSMTQQGLGAPSSQMQRSPRYSCALHLNRMHRIWDIANVPSHYFPTLGVYQQKWETILAGEQSIRAATSAAAEKMCELVQSKSQDIVLESVCDTIAILGNPEIEPLCLFISANNKRNTLKEIGDYEEVIRRSSDIIRRIIEDEKLARIVQEISPYFLLLSHLQTDLAIAYDKEYQSLNTERCELFDKSSKQSFPSVGTLDDNLNQQLFGNLPVNEYLKGAKPFRANDISRLTLPP